MTKADEETTVLNIDQFTQIQEIRIQKRGQWSRTITLPVWKVVAFLTRKKTVKLLSCDRPTMQRYLVIDLGEKK